MLFKGILNTPVLALYILFNFAIDYNGSKLSVKRKEGALATRMVTTTYYVAGMSHKV